VQSPVPTTTTEEERRPAAILAIYSWDMVLALLALLGALAAFGGQATVGSRTVGVSLGEQILAGVESASFAGLLIILATLLTRRHRWVRTAQMATLAIAIGLGAVSLLLAAVVPGQGLQASALTALLVLVVDAAAIVALTAQRVAAWYNQAGSMPRYISATIIFWASASAVLIVLQSLR
jgi:hypothetical protein